MPFFPILLRERKVYSGSKTGVTILSVCTWEGYSQVTLVFLGGLAHGLRMTLNGARVKPRRFHEPVVPQVQNVTAAFPPLLLLRSPHSYCVSSDHVRGKRLTRPSFRPGKPYRARLRRTQAGGRAPLPGNVP